MNIWVYVDHFQGKALPASWEAIGAAKSLGANVSALVLGNAVEELASAAIHYGADEVFLADAPALKDYTPEPFTSVIAGLAKEKSPDAIFFPTTTRGRELGGMLAVDLNSGVLVDVVSLEIEGDQLVAVRPIYAGKLLQKVVCNAKPQIVTLRGRAFPKPEADPSRSGAMTRVPVDVEPLTQVEGYEVAEEGVSLTDAGVIVSGGRGTSNNPNLTPPDGMSDEEAEIWRAQQGFQLIGELANVLGGAVGASRAAVDAGYIPYSHQVGQTGKVVSPDLYIACGISGAIQHLAGMRNSKVIVAINKDPDAPIFKVARYGVVGDLFEIVPALTEVFKKKLGK
jgi:electron transfer flavoprotein alpha subunit